MTIRAAWDGWVRAHFERHEGATVAVGSGTCVCFLCGMGADVHQRILWLGVESVA